MTYYNNFIKLYSLYGFHQGFTGNSHYYNFQDISVILYTDKIALGTLTAATYVSILPISLYFDLRKIEKYLRYK